jgi:hypothetical protein
MLTEITKNNSKLVENMIPCNYRVQIALSPHTSPSGLVSVNLFFRKYDIDS